MSILSKEEITKLPGLAKLALAARCARLVFPFYQGNMQDEVEAAIIIVEEMAADALAGFFIDTFPVASTYAEDVKVIEKAADAAFFQSHYFPAAAAAAAAARTAIAFIAAQDARNAAAHDNPDEDAETTEQAANAAFTTAAAFTAAAALTAAPNAAAANVISEQIREDFEVILYRVKQGDEFFPLSVFLPPEDFYHNAGFNLAESKPKDTEIEKPIKKGTEDILLEIEVGDASPKEIAEVFLKMDQLYRAMGGSGLVFSEDGIMSVKVREGVPA